MSKIPSLPAVMHSRRDVLRQCRGAVAMFTLFFLAPVPSPVASSYIQMHAETSKPCDLARVFVVCMMADHQLVENMREGRQQHVDYPILILDPSCEAKQLSPLTQQAATYDAILNIVVVVII